MALPLKYSIVTQPANGTLSGQRQQRDVHADGTYFGADSFTFTVNDALRQRSRHREPDGESAGADGESLSVTVNYQTATPLR